MALSFLIDTSVLTRLAHPAVREVVEPLAVDGQLARPRICDLEIGYSARNADEWDRLMAAVDLADAVDTTAAHVRRALQVQRLLAERSHRGRRVPDLLVAAAAESLDLAVLHYDNDFDLIAAVTGQRCRCPSSRQRSRADRCPSSGRVASAQGQSACQAVDDGLAGPRWWRSTASDVYAEEGDHRHITDTG
ncbi:MAG: PIN domain-containing protein [Dermatophilaceae bacterium]